MDDPVDLDPVDLDHPDVDVDTLATDQSAFVAKGNGGLVSEFVLYSVDDDIIPRQYRRLLIGQHQEHLYGNYDYLGGWSERVRNTSGQLLTYVLPVLIVTFIVGALLTVVPLRRLYSSVLSTAFYVFASLVVDFSVLLMLGGAEWMRAATSIDIRTVITGSNAVLCKIYPFVTSFAIQLSSWLTVVMAAETAWVYQRPQRLTTVCRLQRARRVLGGLLIALGLSNVHLLWTYTIHSSSHGVGMNSQSTDQPVCIDRLAHIRAISTTSENDDALTLTRDVGHLVTAGFRFAVSQMIPYFVVFSCAVMLVTKRWRRRDQLRQVDNTWKACNVDASAGRQLHTAFAVLCVVHSVMLLPRLAFDSFQFVTDPRLTGHRSISYRPGSVLAKSVVYILHYAFIAVRPVILLAVCSAVRRRCANEVVTSTQLGICCCSHPKRKSSGSRHMNRRSPSSLSGDGSIAGLSGAAEMALGDQMMVAGEPLLQKSTIVENNHHGGGGHHVTFNDITKTDDVIGTPLPPLPPAPPPPPSSAAIVMENGTPCIKIFSMTSV